MSSFEELEKKADAGDAEAQNELGLMYESGNGVRKDVKKAAHYYQLSAEQANSLGAYQLARLLEKTPGIIGKNQNSSVKYYYQMAAEAGIPQASTALGRIHKKDKSMRKDVLQWLRTGADNGDVEGQYELAAFLEKDPKKDKNKTTDIMRYYKLAADNGHAEAQAAYGLLLEKGQGKGKRNVKGAIQYYRKSAAQGNPKGQFQLARMYENGFGMEKDIDQAIRYYRLSSHQNYVQATMNLARLFQANDRLPEALDYMKRAADSNNFFAMMEYSKMVESSNPEEAARYMKKAGECTTVGPQALEAQVNYGKMVCAGIGVSRSDCEAFRIFKAAAAKGSPEAMFQLCNMMKVGRGCVKNEPEAFKMLEQAANAGHEKAKEIYDKLIAKQRNERQAAQAAAAEEERLQKIHAEKSKRKLDEEEERILRLRQARARGRGGFVNKGIPSQGAPKAAPLTPQQIAEQHRQQQLKQQKMAELQAAKILKSVSYENDSKDTKSFIEMKEEQKKNGGPKAQYKLAKRFLQPETLDLKLAYHFMKLAAERIPDAMMQLSELLEKGEIAEPIGEPKYEASRHYLHCATRINYVPGMLRLSQIYADGIGVEVDKTESIRYLKLAADTGDAESQYRISKLLLSGDMGKPNAELAAEYLKKSASGNYMTAQLELLEKYKGTAESVPYIEGAADNGHLESMRAAGLLYRDGGLVAADHAKAKKYLAMAAEKGTEEDKAVYEAFIAKGKE